LRLAVSVKRDAGKELPSTDGMGRQISIQRLHHAVAETLACEESGLKPDLDKETNHKTSYNTLEPRQATVVPTRHKKAAKNDPGGFVVASEVGPVPTIGTDLLNFGVFTLLRNQLRNLLEALLLRQPIPPDPVD